MDYEPQTDNWIDIFDFVVDTALGYCYMSANDFEIIQRRVHEAEHGGPLAPLWGVSEFWDAMEALEERVAA